MPLKKGQHRVLPIQLWEMEEHPVLPMHLWEMEEHLVLLLVHLWEMGKHPVLLILWEIEEELPRFLARPLLLAMTLR